MRTPLFLSNRVLAASLACLLSQSAIAQDRQPGTTSLYTLIDGSTLIDDCPICDRMPFIEPLRGTYQLRLLSEDPLFAYYAVENICFTNIGNSGRQYLVTGSGHFEIGGEVALRQNLTLDLTISNGFEGWVCYFTNTSARLTRIWPMMQVSVEQTNGTATQQFHLDLNAAPLREIWFSTAEKFAGADLQEISAGDLLSFTGRRVKSNHDLTANLGIMPAVPDLGLKDIEILAGGEILFSIEEDVWSESLGALAAGDLLSNRGRIVRKNTSLLAGFEPDPQPTGGAGLDAVKLPGNGQTWFSVQQDFFSKHLGRIVGHGSLLSDNGTETRSNGELVSRFGPLTAAQDYGLKAVFLWPSGEIWFTTTSKFEGTNFMHYNAGDLLSDQGYIVFRNSELLSAFKPATALTNMSLDALWVVTDLLATNPAPVLNAPHLTNQPPDSLLLEWRGEGRVFQLERATDAAGPFRPITPISPDTTAVDPRALTNGEPGFYRVRQW